MKLSSSASFIPNYTFGQWVVDSFWGATYPFWSGNFWVMYWPDLIASFVYFVGGFYIMYYFLRLEDTKRFAWALSLLNALVVTSLSLPVCFILFERWFREGNNEVIAFMLSNHRLTEFICIFFGEFMIFDLSFGIIYYQCEMDFLTWSHHIAYAFLTMNALYWKYANGFISFFPEELPTVILAVGSVFPYCRSDIGFGITFLMLRIVFHAVMVVVAIAFTRQYTMSWIMALITMMLHVWWFRRWLLSMRRKEEQRKALGLNAQEKDDERSREEETLIGPEDHHPLPDE